MRICLPTEAPGGPTAALSGHFGSAPTFTLMDTDSGTVEVLENSGPHNAGHHHTGGHEHGHHHGEHGGGGCRSARLVAGQGIDAVICGSIGRNAMKALGEAKFYAANGGTVTELVTQLSNGTLQEHTEGCAGRHH